MTRSVPSVHESTGRIELGVLEISLCIETEREGESLILATPGRRQSGLARHAMSRQTRKVVDQETLARERLKRNVTHTCLADRNGGR